MTQPNRRAGRRAVWLAACSLFLILSRVPGQTAGTGALTGTVADPNGGLVADVQIRIVDEVTGETRTALTLHNGNYTIPLLRPGAYQVEFAKTGFKKAVKTGL